MSWFLDLFTKRSEVRGYACPQEIDGKRFEVDVVGDLSLWEGRSDMVETVLSRQVIRFDWWGNRHVYKADYLANRGDYSVHRSWLWRLFHEEA